MDDFLATIFLGSMSVLITLGLFLYQDRLAPKAPAAPPGEVAAKLVTVQAKP